MIHKIDKTLKIGIAEAVRTRFYGSFIDQRRTPAPQMPAGLCLKSPFDMTHRPIASADGIHFYHVKTAGTIVDLSLP